MYMYVNFAARKTCETGADAVWIDDPKSTKK